MMAGNYRLNIATISDIHLGHPKVLSKNIIAGLMAAFPDNKTTGMLDIIFIAGDLFDRILNMPDSQVKIIYFWMQKLLTICYKWNIKLRILEGTPSHDRGQSSLFITMNDIGRTKTDVAYIDTVHVEHMADLDLHILYVPDEWRHDPSDTWADVKGALRKAGVEKVDYAIMHGVFEHQLPWHLKLPSHKANNYLGIVKKYITIGHHHTMTTYGRIHAQGSFDRLRHGEEEAKGHFRWHVKDRDTNDLDEIVFVENQLATVFKTLDLVGLEKAAVIEKLTSTASYPIGSFIRVRIDRTSPYLAEVDAYRKAKSEYNWDISTSREAGEQYIQPITIAKSSITELNKTDLPIMLVDRLIQKGRDPTMMGRVKKLLHPLL